MKSTLMKNYMYSILNIATGILFPILLFPYISRILMPDYLGKVVFSQSIVNYFMTIALLGIPVYGVRELSKVRKTEEFSKIFTELIIIGFVGSLFCFAILSILTYKIEKFYLIRELIIIYSFQVFFAFLNLDHVFITLEKHKRRALRTFLLKFISLGLIFILVRTKEDYLIYVTILVIPELLARFFDLISCREFIFKNIKNLNIRRHFKPLLIIFMYIFATGIYVNLDSSMLGFFKNDRDVGLYTVAIRMARICIPILSALGTVLSPRIITYIKQQKKDKIYKLMDVFLDFSILLGLPIVFLMNFLAKDLVLLFSGVDYIEAVPTMKIITWIILFIPITVFLGGQVLLPNNKEKEVFKTSFAGLILNILLNYLLIFKYGGNGAAVATVLNRIPNLFL